jgi:hypothetical protein
MESCWAEDEDVRPRFDEVVVALDEMRAADGCMRYGSSRCVGASNGHTATAVRSKQRRRICPGVCIIAVCFHPRTAVL